MMERPEILTSIREAFRFLIDKGFDLEYVYSSKYFGNYVATFRNPDMQFILVNDRGFVFMDVARSQQPEEWFDLGVMLEHLHHENVSVDARTEADKAQSWALWLQKHFESVARAFDEEHYPETRKMLRQLQRERAQKLLGIDVGDSVDGKG